MSGMTGSYDKFMLNNFLRNYHTILQVVVLSYSPISNV